MFKFLKKDLIVNRTALLINLAVWIVISTYMFWSGISNLYLFIGIIYLILNSITPLSVDDKLNVNSLLVSLPVKRSNIVFFRYSVSLIFILAYMVLMFSYGTLLDMLIPGSKTDFSQVTSWGVIFTVLFIAIIAVSFFIPFTYRFGQMGLIIGLAAAMLGTTTLFVFTALGLKVGIIKNILVPLFEKLLEGGITSITNLFGRLYSNIGIPLAVILTVGVMAIFIFISIRISLFVYSRKEF